MAPPDPVEHDVVFELNGGSGFFSPQIVSHGDLVDPPERIPVRAGYEFVGWFVDFDGDEPFDFSSPILEDITIHAGWEVEVIFPMFLTVSFELHGGVMNSDFASQSIRLGTTATRPSTDPVRAGYQFKGWFTAAIGGAQFNFSLPILDDFILHAQWESLPLAPPDPVEHDVVFELNGGSGFFPPQIVLHGDLVEPPEREPIRSEHEFVGWTTVMNSYPDVFDFKTPIIQHTILYALWELNIFSNPDPPPLITVRPPESSGIKMEVDENGAIVITGPQIGEGAIIISNAPLGVEFVRVGAFNEIFILFPGCTEPETIEVTTPTDDWTYEYYHDVPGNLILAILPPGVDLATVLSDPLNPQPRDRSLLNLPEEQMSPAEDVNQDEEDGDFRLLDVGALSSSPILLGMILLMSGYLLSSVKARVRKKA